MNKAVLITGASRGIGRQIALTLAKNGYDIAVNYLYDEEDPQATVKDITALGVNAYAFKADVSNFEGSKKLVEDVIAKFGALYALVNNAGITRDGMLGRMKEEDWDLVIAVNLKSVFNTCRHAVPHMMKQKQGRIVNMASVVGLAGQAGQTNYAASKGGIIAFTKALAQEIGPRGVTVNAVAPGFVKTPMTDALTEKARDQILNSIPLRRGGEPTDIADTVAFLIGDGAAYITGQTISVNGGMY